MSVERRPVLRRTRYELSGYEIWSGGVFCKSGVSVRSYECELRVTSYENEGRYECKARDEEDAYRRSK